LDGLAFSAVGTIKHLKRPGGQTQAALMRSYMACCAADALALGFRLTGDTETSHQEGDWIVVSGTLSRLPEPDPIASFRMGTATFATIQEDYVIELTRIVDYTTTLPSVIEQLTAESTAQFAQALQVTDLWEALEGDGPFTVFAPMNQAFEQIDPNLLSERGPPRAWLANHIVSGRYVHGDLYDVASLQTIHGQDIQIRVENGQLSVQGARVVFKNKVARNGVVHIIYPCLDVIGEKSVGQRSP
jgi:uncharacterized surface protein with fasciclin (FAS1) repeats